MLAVIAMHDENTVDIEAMRVRLEAERGELVDAGTRRNDERKPVALDQQSVGRLSRMDAMQMQAMAQAAERRRLARIRQIEAALKRIRDDEYGDCIACGEKIPAKRLDFDPAVATCVACAGGGRS